METTDHIFTPEELAAAMAVNKTLYCQVCFDKNPCDCTGFNCNICGGVIYKGQEWRTWLVNQSPQYGHATCIVKETPPPARPPLTPAQEELKRLYQNAVFYKSHLTQAAIIVARELDRLYKEVELLKGEAGNDAQIIENLRDILWSEERKRE